MDRRGLVGRANPLFPLLVEQFITEEAARYRGAMLTSSLPVLVRYFSAYNVLNIDAAAIASFLASLKVGPQTKKHHLTMLSALFRFFSSKYGYEFNPAKGVRRPPSPAPRSRRLSVEEGRALMNAAQSHPMLYALLVVLLETGMRCGEALALTAGDINIPERTALLKGTKDPRGRYRQRFVPLSLPALNALLNTSLAAGDSSARLFSAWKDSDSLNYLWRKVKASAGVSDFHLHDLRHEAISRFVEAGLSDLEVMQVAGHLSHAMLVRYAHLRPSATVKRLDAHLLSAAAVRSW
jgi:integrase